MEYIKTKKIIHTNKPSPYWFNFKYNMNIYHGCNHNCIYCDSRSDCYNISNFHIVRAKENALEMINKELKGKRVKGIISTGSMSDPYNPYEKKLNLTGEALKIIDYYKFGIAIYTKSDLITRDINILKNINKHSSVFCGITITTFSDELSKILEPFAPSTSRRFEALKKLSKEGFYCGILLQPILPFINDDIENIKSIVEKAYECGVDFIYPSFGVTLRDSQREFFYDKIDKYFPHTKLKYINSFKNNYYCKSKNSKELFIYFKELCNKYNISYNLKDIEKGYTKEDNLEQITLF